MTVFDIHATSGGPDMDRARRACVGRVLRWGALAGLSIHGLGGAAQPTVGLSSLEWPPYTGATLPGQGITTAVVRRALESAGSALEVHFYPWNRAVALARQGSGPGRVDGYFPEYWSADVEAEFIMSDAIGTSPLGLVERVAKPVTWSTLDDLSRHRIGVVNGYVNTVELDRRIRNRSQPTDMANDDRHNLLKLVAGRVDLAVIDRRVFEYLVAHDPRIAPVAGQLRFQPRLLEEKKLYACFGRHAQGERACRILNAGLARTGTSGP